MDLIFHIPFLGTLSAIWTTQKLGQIGWLLICDILLAYPEFLADLLWSDLEYLIRPSILGLRSIILVFFFIETTPKPIIPKPEATSTSRSIPKAIKSRQFQIDDKTPYVINPKVLEFYREVFQDFSETILKADPDHFLSNPDSLIAQICGNPLEASLASNITDIMLGCDGNLPGQFHLYQEKVGKIKALSVQFLSHFFKNPSVFEAGLGFPRSHELKKAITELIESKSYINQANYRSWLTSKDGPGVNNNENPGGKQDQFLRSKFAVTEMFNRTESVFRAWLKEILENSNSK